MDENLHAPPKERNEDAHEALGTAVSAFAWVELEVYRLLDVALNHEPVQKLSVMGGFMRFEARTALLIKYVQQYYPEKEDVLEPLLIHANKLSRQRNRYVHNPMFTSFGTDERPEGSVGFHDAKNIGEVFPDMTAESMRALAKECCDCAMELQDMLFQIDQIDEARSEESSAAG